MQIRIFKGYTFKYICVQDICKIPLIEQRFFSFPNSTHRFLHLICSCTFFYSFLIVLLLSHMLILQITHLLSELGSSLSDGALKKDYVLDNSQHLISFIRNCNITLRWLLLHRIVSPCSYARIFSFYRCHSYLV